MAIIKSLFEIILNELKKLDEKRITKEKEERFGKLISKPPAPAPKKEVPQKGLPKDDTVIHNEMPMCMRCGKPMSLNGYGTHHSQAGTPVEYSTMFCIFCSEVAIAIARTKVDRASPYKPGKPSLAYDVYWSHPVSRKETNERLAKLAEDMDKYEEGAPNEETYRSPN